MNKQRILYLVIGGVLGAIAGYFYYHYIGCASGTCAITSKPVNSTLYGTFMGGLVLDMVHDFRNKKEKEDEE